ncbi:MAG: HDOD domain-containing protein [Hydrogenoanaerobacterium sp.]
MVTKVVRQPIISSNKELLGYEILYQDGASSLYNQADTQAANAIENFLLEFDSEKFLEGKTAFLTFTPNLLLKNIPRMFKPEKLVIQIEDSSIIHPLAQKIIYRYKKQGYKIAVKNFEFSPRYFALLDVVDIIKLDFAKLDVSQKSIVDIGESFQKQIIAYNVNTPEAYAHAIELGCKYLQGTAVAEAMSSQVKRMDHMQSNFFQLVVAVTKDEPDVDAIAEIISRDVTLAFSLIKLVNSAYFALRNKAKSVKQALVVLGLGQLKQWVYLLSFKQSDGQFSTELVKISFLRANFCSELSQFIPNLPISKSEAYLMGMFSTLGLLMEVPLEDALTELPISDEVKQALLTGEGRCGMLYRLVGAYEKASWDEVSTKARELNIPENIISQKYFECVEYVNQIWSELMSVSDEVEKVDDEK